MASSRAVVGRERLVLAVLAAALATGAAAHEIGGRDGAFVAAALGPDLAPFAYLGAKHMVTGYDHLLFLVGVVFYLTRLREVALYVSLFSLGHSITLLAGVYLGLRVDPRLVDAVIGASVIYKAFDNLGGFRTLLGIQPDGRAAVFGFGLVHGFGLATKLQALRLNPDGLLPNLLAFNAGVEIGQFLALALIVLALGAVRRSGALGRLAVSVNVLLMAAGLALVGQHTAHLVLDGAFR